jgi:thiamine kinase-like enzyme
MKRFIKNIIIKILQKTGIYVQYFPTSKQIYDFLKGKPLQIRKYELNRIVATQKLADNHKQYEKLLKAFIPDWQIEIKEAQFTGNGFSPSNLNTYRKVTTGDKLYFEKVYFNDHRSLQAVQWFQKYIYDLIKDEIKAPSIQKIFRGELLTIVYYDYISIAELGEETEERSLIQFSIILYNISCAYESYLRKLAFPDLIRNFKNNNHTYRRHINKAKTRLQEEDINIKSFQKSLDHSKCILTHSDIHERNGFKKGILIDWDFFGIYPVGFDPAMIYYRRMKHKKVKNYHCVNWLREHYRTAILEEDWRDFERNFIYCLFVFSIKLFNKGLFKSIERQLIEKLKYYSNTE